MYDFRCWLVIKLLPKDFSTICHTFCTGTVPYDFVQSTHKKMHIFVPIHFSLVACLFFSFLMTVFFFDRNFPKRYTSVVGAIVFTALPMNRNIACFFPGWGYSFRAYSSVQSISSCIFFSTLCCFQFFYNLPHYFFVTFLFHITSTLSHEPDTFLGTPEPFVSIIIF